MPTWGQIRAQRMHVDVHFTELNVLYAFVYHAYIVGHQIKPYEVFSDYGMQG